MTEELSEREQSLIGRHGDFYRSLNGGQRKPQTPEQEHFVEVCRGRTEPMTEHEIAFTKFLRIVKVQREIEAASKAAEAEARQNIIEHAPGQRAYPSSLDRTFDSAAAWASQNGFRGV